MGEGTLRNRSLRDTTLRGMTEGRDTEEQQQKKTAIGVRNRMLGAELRVWTGH